MIDPLTIGLTLAKIAGPSLIKYFTGNDLAASVADKVIDIAKVVTHTDSGEDALEVIKTDPNKMIEFRLAISQRDADLEKAYLADMADARARDVEIIKSGHTNWRGNAMSLCAFLLVIGCLCVTVWSTEMDDFAKAAITLILGRALGWVEQVFSFEFGSTRGSRTKDDTISKLSK